MNQSWTIDINHKAAVPNLRGSTTNCKNCMHKNWFAKMCLNRFLIVACVLIEVICNTSVKVKVVELKCGVFIVTAVLNRTWNICLVPSVLYFLSRKHHRRLLSSAAGVELAIKAVVNTSSFDYWSPWNDANRGIMKRNLANLRQCE